MTSKHFAVIGSPIDHSLSPKIHEAAYRFLGLDWDYSRFNVHEGSLENFLAIDGTHLSGISVTMPLKLEAAEVAIRSDEIVRLLGVANTLVKAQDGYHGFNTDVFGIERALDHCWSPSVKRIAIIGAGATAQSALYAASRKAPNAQVIVYARDTSRTQGIQALSDELGVSLEVADFGSYSTVQDLTISTIPSLALDNLVAGKQSGWLLNASYSSKDSSFTEQFNSDRAVSGETMLIWQAIAQIRIFVQGSADVELENEEELFANMASAL
jgi:shikimate dehydrogenase